ncbi:MAG: hypothetical protein CFE25_03430 [Chitinophagaceae bacterium BSSC1]|nr:MAG: hypothetical protein CFE25_03430 [Chitinophagaceae bacterium BSSC1]
MKKNLFHLFLLLFTGISSQAQPVIELKSVDYYNFSGRTLNYLEFPEIRQQLVKSLDSLSKKYLQIPVTAALDFKINKKLYQQNSLSEHLNLALTNMATKEKISADATQQLLNNGVAGNPTKTNFKLEIAELPLNSLRQFPDLDSLFIQQLLQKQNIALIQMVAKLQAATGEMLIDKQVCMVLSRNKQPVLIGFNHPDYLITPKSFGKLMEAGLSVLLDRNNETEILQMTSLAAIVNDNFIQPHINNQPRLSFNTQKGIIQYLWKGALQYLRYQEPLYENIVIRGKKATPIANSLVEQITADNMWEPLFLREESRDILADKNYMLQCVVNVERDPYGKGTPFNKKTGLPFNFLSGNSHVFLQDKDTVALFKIKSNLLDGKKKKILNQLYLATDSSFFAVENTPRETIQHYDFELEGILKGQAFKISYTGLRGSPESIREIYLKEKLVAVIEGKDTPELLVVLDKDIDGITLNQLLLLSFSNLF